MKIRPVVVIGAAIAGVYLTSKNFIFCYARHGCSLWLPIVVAEHTRLAPPGAEGGVLMAHKRLVGINNFSPKERYDNTFCIYPIG